MSRRVTIMLNDDLDKKLRLRQAVNIKEFQETYSFSQAVNDALRKALK